MLDRCIRKLQAVNSHVEIEGVVCFLVLRVLARCE